MFMKKNYQRSCTRFLAKHEGRYIYYIHFESRYSIDDENIHFVNGYGYALIDNPNNLDGTSTDHEYFFIHDDLFNIILETE